MIKIMPQLWIIGLISLSVPLCTGYEAYFPVSNIHMHIPTDAKLLDELKGMPIHQFSMNHFPDNGPVNMSLCRFQFDNEDEQRMLQQSALFTIGEHTGDVSLSGDFGAQESPIRLTINIKCAKARPNHVSLTVEPVKVRSRAEFCKTHLDKICFWDSAVYSIVETDAPNGQHGASVEIGEISSLVYRRLCPDLSFDYRLANATEYLAVHGNVLRTSGNKSIDHDSPNPGPLLFAELQCTVQLVFNAPPVTIRKVVEVTVLDKNDNYPEVHNGALQYTMPDPHFKKDTDTKLSTLYMDKDTLAINRMQFDILNDTLRIFRLQTMPFEDDRTGNRFTLYHNNLFFAKTGILPRSPYCVTIRARDQEYLYATPSTNLTDARACLEADMSKVAVQVQPVPAPLIQGQQQMNSRGSANPKKTIETISADEMAIKRLIQRITYPNEIRVLRTAQNFSRLAQPEFMVNISRINVKFRIQNDPTNSIGITRYGGIIFIRNNVNLFNTHAEIFSFSFTFNNRSETIRIHIDSAPTNASTTCAGGGGDSTIRVKSCAEKRKSQCVKYCGVGTNGASCQWRENNLKFLTDLYGTCSPDFKYCPDKFCDPLEDLAHREKVYLCPQDCTDRAVGSSSTDRRIGITSATRNCICDSVGACSCGHDDEDLDQPKPPPSSSTKRNKKKQNLELNEGDLTTERTKQKTPRCGVVCLGLVVTCPLLIIFIVAVLLARHSRVLKLKQKRLLEKTNSHDEAPMPLVPLNSPFVFKSDPDSKWEFPRGQLVLDTILGEGEFGKVLKGYATDIDSRPGETTVAVKMLKTGANSVELAALMSEFQLLQEVAHPNVIRLLGACTQHGEAGPLLIIEYCKHGSLRNYLRLSRKIECAGIEYPDGVEAVTVKDILSFAWQICKGMAYLTDNKLVHRDLAARNVLLAEGKVCKVSDFGLTRDVYEDDAYLKRSKDRVPVKWMAPESLADHVYTNRSDVWAFGVLAWELITLGASPYPGIPPQNLYHLLKQGYRMEKPDHCSEEIYSIVRSCWADDPIGRPSFKVLAGQFEKLLGNNAKYLELEQNAISNPLYCADNEKELPQIETELDEDSLEHLWYPPNRNSLEMAEAELNNLNGFNRESTKLLQSARGSMSADGEPNQMGYDVPRPLIEAKTTEQRIRYENEVMPSMRRSASQQARNSYMNDPRGGGGGVAVVRENKLFLVKAGEASEHNNCSSTGYETPRHSKSYVDMSSSGSNNPSDNGSSVYYKTVKKNNRNISNNLDSKSDKKVSKDLSFKFMSLLNLSEDSTSVI